MSIVAAFSLAAHLVARGWQIEMLCLESLPYESDDTAVYSLSASYRDKRHLFIDDSDAEQTWIERLERRAQSRLGD